MTKKPLTSNSGMTLIEVMIAVAISSIVILASVSVGQMTMQTQAQNNISFQADIIRRNMVALVSSTGSWNNTIAANSSTACLAAGTACTAATPQNIYIIKDGANSSSGGYDVSSGKGFNNDGSPCVNSGSFVCPLTYTIQWSAMCGGAVSCVNPQVKVVVTPTYTPPSAAGSQKLIFNAANYGFTLYR